ncbi:MAG: mannitol dehydrogenase family protein [Firmicutes bacterium]|nr:mannitol dehydrogenase family protein [Bacillota bacterium]
MKLNLQNLSSFPENYTLPKFDVHKMAERTKAAPTWLHMGAGNIFRIMIGGIQQNLLDEGLTDTGIIAYEAFDDAIIPLSFTPYNNLTLGVTLYANGNVDKRVIASIADAFSCNLDAVRDVIAKPSLQMISFTITENGYKVDPAKVCESPDKAVTTMEQTAAGLLSRFQASGGPIALVSLDNFAENGTQVEKAMATIAKVWHKNGHVPVEFIDYVKTMAYPWTMIDKITPRPSEDIAKLLAADGYEDTEIHKTPKNTFVASFVNAESAQYLVLEDNFPGGRPPFEKSGVYMTDKETVRKMDQMKVCACLNPLHTILGVAGPLLKLPTISACMKDERLVKLLSQAAGEALPTVAHPGIIDPADFLNVVLTERFPNPYIPDTPERIACDTSQKIPVRFGVAMKARKEKGIPTANLEAVPLFAALWLRYRMGLDDTGAPMELSPDPLLPQPIQVLDRLKFGEKADLHPILSNAETFGVNLYEVGLGEKIEDLFYQLSAGPGAVSQKLTQVY